MQTHTLPATSAVRLVEADLEAYESLRVAVSAAVDSGLLNIDKFPAIREALIDCLSVDRDCEEALVANQTHELAAVWKLYLLTGDASEMPAGEHAACNAWLLAHGHTQADCRGFSYTRQPNLIAYEFASGA